MWPAAASAAAAAWPPCCAFCAWTRPSNSDSKASSLMIGGGGSCGKTALIGGKGTDACMGGCERPPARVEVVLLPRRVPSRRMVLALLLLLLLLLLRAGPCLSRPFDASQQVRLALLEELVPVRAGRLALA